MSKKRAKLNREVAGWRKAFLAEFPLCQNPGCIPNDMDQECVHEIAKGAHRAEAIKHRECCLVLCDYCNFGPFNDYSKWPPERQLALKLITDPTYFDLELFNKVRGRAATAIALADLVPYLELKRC